MPGQRWGSPAGSPAGFTTLDVWFSAWELPVGFILRGSTLIMNELVAGFVNWPKLLECWEQSGSVGLHQPCSNEAIEP